MAQLVIDGKAHRLLLDFDAACGIEEELATSMLALAQKLAEGMISMRELLAVVQACVEPGLDLKRAVIEMGAVTVTQVVTEMFVEFFRGSKAALSKDELAVMIETY